jgi:hypothetical protein
MQVSGRYVGNGVGNRIGFTGITGTKGVGKSGKNGIITSSKAWTTPFDPTKFLGAIISGYVSRQRN